MGATLVARRFERYTHVKNIYLPAAAALLATGCSTLSPTEDPVALRMQDLEARLIRIERVVENQSLVQLSTEVDRLRSEAAALRGQLETLRFETENSDSRQRELYVDVDRRLQTLETAPRAFAPAPSERAPSSPSFGAPSEAPPIVAQRPAGSDQQNYQAAFDMISARRYAEAGTAFETFLTQFPTSPLADNAQYWLAETYYVRSQFQEALPEFRKVIEQYPQSAKLPDALLKVGYCQIELGDRSAARSSLQEVMRQFPDTTAARLASQRLGQLR
jgi:tol-pal system protein YbgF